MDDDSPGDELLLGILFAVAGLPFEGVLPTFMAVVGVAIGTGAYFASAFRTA